MKEFWHQHREVLKPVLIIIVVLIAVQVLFFSWETIVEFLADHKGILRMKQGKSNL